MLSFLLAANFDLARIDQLAGSENLKGATVGIVIADAGGKVIYEKNADLRMIPASNQKILSAAYAMGALGPAAKLRTKFWKSPEGLIVEAPGDPMITSDQLKKVATELQIGPGGMVFAKQAFRVGPPPTWEWDDLPYRYAGPITAFSVDNAAWELFSDKGALILPPSGFGLKIDHRRQTGPVSADFNPWLKQVDVNGSLKQERARVGIFSLPEPDRAAASILGGRLSSSQRNLPSGAPDAIIESPPMSQIIKECLEPSDNVIAEHLLLTAASGQEALPEGAYPAAAARMRKFFVEKVGLTENDLRPVDGSGLSRQNLVTPSALVKILRWADAQEWGPLFVEGLAAPGEGTLASRLKTVKFAGKTGTINAVSSLSGIIRPGEPDRLYISIVFNGAISSSGVLRALQDEIVSAAAGLTRHEHAQVSAISKDDPSHPSYRAAHVGWILGLARHSNPS